MRGFKLHTKTTLLSSTIIVAMLVGALVLTTAAIANIERTDDQALAEIQARDLAQHISDMGPSRDAEALARATNLIKGSRPNILSVRFWQLSQGEFSERAAASGSAPATPIPEDTKNALRRGPGPTVVSAIPSPSLYRVFATTFDNGRPSGEIGRASCRERV